MAKQDRSRRSSADNELGRALVEAGWLTQKQFETAKTYRRSLGGNLSTIIAKLNFISDEKLTEFIAHLNSLPTVEIESIVIPVDLINTVPRETIEKYEVLPIQKKEKVLTLAMADPTDYEALEEVQFITQMRVEVQVASRQGLQKAIKAFFETIEGRTEDPVLKDLKSDSNLATRTSGPKLTPLRQFEVLLPALVPLLIEKGVITMNELKQMWLKLK